MNINKDLYNLKKECIKFMEEKNVSNIYIDDWNTFFEEGEQDSEDYNSIESLIVGDILNDKETAFFLKDNVNLNREFKKELYKVLCTSSDEYKTEVNTIGEFVDKAIPVLSTSLAGKYGMDAAIVSGTLSILLCGCFKFGKNMWCSIYKEEFED